MQTLSQVKSTKSTHTQIILKQKVHTQTANTNFEELVPSILPLLKKNTRLGHAGTIDHSDSSILKYNKRMDGKDNH